MTNSRQKGARGEREARDELNRLFGWGCRRGQQFCGGSQSGDLADIPVQIHFEVKRVERLDLVGAMVQAVRDAGDKVPVVMHRRNHGDWMVSLLLDDLPRLVGELQQRTAATAAGGE